MALPEYETDFVKFLVDGDQPTLKIVTEFAEKRSPRSSVFEERLVIANALVDEGNSFFKKGMFREAQGEYISAAYHADFDFGQWFEMMDVHKKQVRDLKIRILLNVTNNLISLRQYHMARKSATLGIVLSDANGDTTSQAVGKLYYRRGRCHLEINHFKEAQNDFKDALQRVPDEDTIKRGLAQATAAVKKEQEDMDKLWKGKGAQLFENASSEPIPAVELVITDNEGNPIEKEKPQQAAVPELTLFEQIKAFLCCKRKRKLQ